MAKMAIPPKVQFFDNEGAPLVGGKVYTYETDTTTDKATYPTKADAIAFTNANANPIILDSRGEATIWLLGDGEYTFKVDDSNDDNIYTQDNITGLFDGTFGDAESIVDSSGNELITFSETASAVNELTITNAATGNNPSIASTGDDTNIGITFKSKGTGGFDFLNGSENSIFSLTNTPSAVNYLTMSNADTGNDPSVTSVGTDTNVGMDLTVKGTGSVNIKNSSTSATPVLKLFEASTNGSNSIALQAPGTLSADYELTLPATGPSTSSLIQSDGSGVLSFSPDAASTSSAGLVEIATAAEAADSTVTDKVLVPSNITDNATLSSTGSVQIGDLIMNWGTVAMTTTTESGTFDNAFDTAVLAIALSDDNSSASAYISNTSTTAVEITGSTTGFNVQYIAIGH